MNILEEVRNRIDEVSQFIGKEEGLVNSLKEIDRFIEVSLAIRMDDGKLKVFKGYRSQHNNTLGIYKGGIRFHENVSEDEVKTLSIWMSLKTSIMGLPLGGGKGGIKVNPKELSEEELERLSRAYVRKIHNIIGKDIDVPAPDVNTNGKIMSIMLDEYMKISGKKDRGTFTGKPLEDGGSLARPEATGYGLAVATECLLNKLNIENPTAIVQGFGNVGSYSAKYLQELGIKVKAIAEYEDGRSFAIYREDGIDIDELLEFKEKNSSILKFPGVKVIDSCDFFKLEADILAPCALENAIDQEIAKNLKVKIIAEGANGPVTERGDKIIDEKGIILIPDVLANGGGVTVSYFEWLQNNNNESWTFEEVQRKERESMTKAFENIWQETKRSKLSLRKAAYVFAVRNILDHMNI